MSRLEEPELIEELRDMRTDADTIKAAQRVGGDSLIGYLTYSDAKYETSVTLAASQMKKLVLTFAFNTATDGAIIDLFPFYAIDNQDVSNNSVPPWANGALILMYVQPLAATSTTMQWHVALRNTDTVTHTAYLKFIFNGTDAGTWTLA